MTKRKASQTLASDQQSSTIRAFVDQVSEGMATLLLGEEESIKVIVPVTWLPEGIGEGMVLRTSFTLDLQASKNEKRQTQELLESLGNNP